MISNQLNTYIEKMQHFQTVSNKVKDRGQLYSGYNTQEVWEIQADFEGVYCLFWSSWQTSLAGVPREM
jgi:hypothetical protein